MKILIIDDEPDICEGLKLFLDAKGHQTRTALSGQQALDLLKHEEVNAVLLDYMMPEMNGIEFFKKLRQTDTQTPVIMVTARGTMDALVEANRLGLVDYITKPIDWGHLDKALEKAFEQWRLMRRVSASDQFPALGPRFPSFVGQSLSLRNLLELLSKAAQKDVTVLILGETGTGKELVARQLHHLSARSKSPFVSINCAALAPNLLESELFGHEKGAFTGADQVKAGLFEVSEGGTFFLDEIGEMPLELQSKLLRVLETGEFRRVGGTRTMVSDVRIIAATNQDLRKMVQEKLFREDLYYRLNIISLQTPPLRSRIEDLPDLINYFLEQFNAKDRTLTPACLESLSQYAWPGNVRELRNTIERLVILGNHTIGVEDLPSHINGNQDATSQHLPLGDISISQVEAFHIEDVLRRQKGNKARAAKILGITKMTLYKKIKEYQLIEFYPKEY